MNFFFSLLVLSIEQIGVPIPPPVSNLVVFDSPNDRGGVISLRWAPCPSDTLLSRYEVWRSEDGVEYSLIFPVPCGTSKIDDNGVRDGTKYWYKVRSVISDSNDAETPVFGPVVSSAQWFHRGRWNALILGIIFSSLALIYIRLAKKGISLYIRMIPGLEAVDDAVGRATEMGRPILYTTGLGFMSDIATIASMSILGKVARRAAAHNTPLIVPCYDPIVMVACQEAVKQAHSEAGRPDTYDESKIFYLTGDQFAYAAGVDGIMLRERPAAVFFQGYFFAEALIMAETGASIGAIQIAGTSAITQLPFFVASCDYTLIGEEMFAASSYLSREPTMLGSIKGEDYAKLLLMGIMCVGAIIATLMSLGVIGDWGNKFINWFNQV